MTYNNDGIYDILIRKYVIQWTEFDTQLGVGYKQLTQLWIFTHHAYVFIHLITIMIQKKLLCVIQFQFHYMHISNHYRIQTLKATQQNRHPARREHAPRTSNFVSKTFLTCKSITNGSCRVLQNFSIVSLLQEKATPCCDLPKKTFPLHRLHLINSNSQI
jgi:hypothetical protein